MKNAGISTLWKSLEEGIKGGKFKSVVVFGPENFLVYDDMDEKVKLFTQAKNLVFLSSVKVPALETYSGSNMVTMIPMKTYIEKDGTFINFQDREQKFKKVTTVVSEALTGIEAAQLLSGADLKVEIVKENKLFVSTNQRQDQCTNRSSYFRAS